MQSDASVAGATWPCYSLLGRDLVSYLRTTRRLSGYLHRQGRCVPFLYSKRSGALLERYLALLFRQDHTFFYMGLQMIVFTLQMFSAILQFPHLPVSSPCLDANEGIDLQVTGSSGFLSSLCYTNQMLKGEPLELLVAKGYWSQALAHR